MAKGGDRPGSLAFFLTRLRPGSVCACCGGRLVDGDCLSQDLDGERRIVSRNDEFDGDDVSRGPRLNRPPRDAIRADGAGYK